MAWILAISIAVLAYIYAGYPAWMWLWAGFGARKVAKGPFQGGVAVLIAARNEAENLPRKLQNLLELSPSEPIREIWIGLDGCTDGTGARVRERLETGDRRRETGDLKPGPENSSLKSIVSSHGSPPGIQIIEFEQPRGKAAVLNDLMARAGQPVWIMMDARQRVEPGAISRLLENFADETVGVVSGALVYESVQGAAQKGAESYWGYEKFLRHCESRVWAVPGATGALYAIRRTLCAPIPENTLVDDVLIPMRAVLAGYRCLFEPGARVFDLPTIHFSRENLRKRRTLAGIWQLIRLEPRIYSFFSNPIWFQWMSHKFLRLLTPFFVMSAIFSVGFLAWEDPGTWIWPFVAAMMAVFTSFLAFWTSTRIKIRIFGLLGAFWSVNCALVLAALDAATGRFEARWKR